MIPPLLVLTPLLAAIAPRPLRRLARLALLGYAGGVLATTAKAACAPETRRDARLLPAVLPIMHWGWGDGTIAGMARFGPPLRAIARLFGCGSDQLDELNLTPGDPSDRHVWAPSLRDEGA